jgi:uncharacterized damage-inducible protein DinB
MAKWENQILDIWRIHSRIKMELLDTIDEDDLDKRLDHYETTIGGQFAHIHRVRLLWLQRQSGLAEGLNEIEESLARQINHIRENLRASAARVEEMLKMGVLTDDELSYFQAHLGAFVGYLIAHECMHHGEIGKILGTQGKALPLEVVWDWNHV